MIRTSVELFETDDYVPEKCKPVSDCPIHIDIWDVNINDEGPVASYAFYSDQLDEAKKVVNSNEDVDIFLDGEEIDVKDFLKI